MTHEQRVMNYIAENGSITIREAVVNLGINCPTKVISNLGKAGVNFNREWVTGKNRYGEETRYKRYTLGVE